MRKIKGSGILGVLLAGMMAGSASAQEVEEPVPDQLPRRETTNIETHAAGADNTEMLQLARSDQGAFIGKDLFFTNGKEVGKIKDIRRRKQDQELYMVVDAEPYFNDEVDFAVPVGDVTRVTDARVELPEGPGMHLRGMEYRADDYVAVDAGEDRPVIVDE